jgi:hypothetical protein
VRIGLGEVDICSMLVRDIFQQPFLNSASRSSYPSTVNKPHELYLPSIQISRCRLLNTAY